MSRLIHPCQLPFLLIDRSGERYSTSVTTETNKYAFANLSPGQRAISGAVGGLLIAAGVAAAFYADSDASASVLLAGGFLFTYLAITDSVVTKANFGNSGFELVNRIMNNESIPEDVLEEVAERVVAEGVRLPEETQDAVSRVRRRAETKHDLLLSIARVAGVTPPLIGAGSSIPSTFFRELATAFNVELGSMPDIAQRIVECAGMTWEQAHWSNGSTVTAAGLRALLEAVRALRSDAVRERVSV